MSFRVSNNAKPVIVSGYNPLPPGQDTQILTNVNGANQYSYPGYNFSGADMFPVNTGDVLGPSLPAGSWSGVNCLGPDGKIYCSPRSGSPVYVFNPYDNTLETIPNATGDFIGMSAAPNGKIYFAPAASTFVGILDPFTRTWDNTSITSAQYPDLALTGSNGKFWRSRLAPNGKIYMAPRSANFIGVVDTNNNTYSSIDISSIVGPVGGGLNYIQSALGKNGFLYMFPHGTNYAILKINPNTNTYTQDISNGNISFLGAITGPDGNPYGIPGAFGSRVIRGIDTSGDVIFDSPLLNTTSTFFPEGAQGAVLSLQGDIWLCPNSYGLSTPQQHLAKYDVSSKLFTYYNIPVSQRDNILRRVGATLAPNGKLYYMPNFEDSGKPDQRVFAFKTGIPTLPNWMIAENFNNSN